MVENIRRSRLIQHTCALFLSQQVCIPSISIRVCNLSNAEKRLIKKSASSHKWVPQAHTVSSAEFCVCSRLAPFKPIKRSARAHAPRLIYAHLCAVRKHTSHHHHHMCVCVDVYIYNKSWESARVCTESVIFWS